MRRARAPERPLEAALSALARALTQSGAPWMIIGGIAIIARGVRRLTTDIDAVVRGDAIAVDRLMTVLAGHRIVPRIRNANAFAEANLVLLLRHEPSGVDLDVSLAWSTFEHEAISSATTARFGDVRAPMSTPSDLVVFKAIAARPRDWEDAEALLVMYPEIDIGRARRRVSQLATLAGEVRLIGEFDKVVARARHSLEPRSPRRRVPKRRSPKPK